MPHGTIWFDAHLDLAYLAVNRRDMLAPLDRAAAPHPPAAVTLPSLAAGNVRLALATIFTEPDGTTGPEAYPVGDVPRAYAAGRAQLEVYLTWRDLGAVAFDLPVLARVDTGIGKVRGGMGVSEVVAPSLIERLEVAERGRSSNGHPLHIGILIENADPIRSPDELGWWVERGVVAVGLAWAKSSRYAGGNTSHDGISPLGRELVAAIDRHRVVHDAAHLSDRAFSDLLDLTGSKVIASHSNSRWLLRDPANQRHLTDGQVRAIVARSGVIGLNLYSKFLDPACAEPGARATIDQALAHVEHVCMLAGHHRAVGLGSDMDGGFAADRTPSGIDTPADLVKLAEGLRGKGWTDDQIADFAHGNWLRVFAR